MSELERHEKAVAQALEIAGRHKLPQRARSLTARENRAMAVKEVGCLFDGGAFLLLVLPFSLLLSGEPGFAWRVAPWCWVAAPIVWGIGWALKRRAGRGYVDPRIEIEASADGVTVWQGDGTSLRHDYAALGVAVVPGAFQRNPFEAAVLELPAPSTGSGQALTLDNGRFRNGRTTGAAILARVKAAGGRVRPAEE